MAIPEDQISEIKEQLLEQIEKLDNPNKEQIKEYIRTLNPEQLEDFLKKNNIKYTENGLTQENQDSSSEPPEKKQECIFCSIIKKEIPSYILATNDKSISILEINPLSKGHSIVLPLEHITVDKLPKASMSLAQKIMRRIKKKLKPEDIKIETSQFMGHALINIIPMYKDTPLKKIKAEDSDLKKLKSKLETKTRSKRKSQEKIIETPSNINHDDNLPKFSFRIP